MVRTTEPAVQQTKGGKGGQGRAECSFYRREHPNPLHRCRSRSHMLQPFLFLWLVMTARMLASVAAVIASSCVSKINCTEGENRGKEMGLWASVSTLAGCKLRCHVCCMAPALHVGPIAAVQSGHAAHRAVNARQTGREAAPAAHRRAPAPQAPSRRRTRIPAAGIFPDRSCTRQGRSLQAGGGRLLLTCGSTRATRGANWRGSDVLTQSYTAGRKHQRCPQGCGADHSLLLVLHRLPSCLQQLESKPRRQQNEEKTDCAASRVPLTTCPRMAGTPLRAPAACPPFLQYWLGSWSGHCSPCGSGQHALLSAFKCTRPGGLCMPPCPVGRGPTPAFGGCEGRAVHRLRRL